MPHIKPRSLRPLSREMRLWRLGFMVAFVGAVAFGWYATVGQSIGHGVRDARAQINDTIMQTKQTAIKDGNPIAPAQDSVRAFQNQLHTSLETVQQESVKQEIFQHVAAQIKSSGK